MSGDEMDRGAFAAADPELLSFVLEESDKRLAAQVQLMLAADQRANGIVAACISLSAAAIGFAISQLGDHKQAQYFNAAIAFGGCEALAALLGLMCLWPEPVNPQGWAPAAFAADVGKSAHAVRAEVAVFIQRRIEQNRRASAKLSRRVKWAMLFAVLGPFLGLCVGMMGSPLEWVSYVSGAVCLGLLVFLGVPLLPASFHRRKNPLQ